MPYTTRDATRTLFGYLGLNETEVEFIPETSNRAFIYNLPNEDRCVIFIYPISRKVDNTKNFFDTRDSGARERGVAWNYALENRLKYFCIAVHDQFERYADYAFSLECNEQRIAQVAGTVDGRRNGSGTQVVIPNDFIPSKPFERILTRFGFYIGVAHKDFLVNYLESYDNRPYMEQDTPVEIPDDEENIPTEGADNILLYGVPGCGKSYTIKTEYCNDDDHMERAVFHPDYTYSDFVGQILPRVDEGHIEYRFEPGPFTRILKKAVESPDESFYLVVEEINRGNAPAIFGDIFQLLDRDESGCSEYGVSNENISQYVYGDVTTKIKIPGNLFVLATMNTSDQNVFTLDTAFKRRWTMRMIENNIDACEYANHQICAWGITWGTFAKTINQKITELGENNLSNEDNRLGAYFVREADLNDAERFGEKILMYLWNDAFKFDHDKVFKAEYRTLDELIAGFVRVGNAVFNDDIAFETIAEETDDIVETDNPTAEQYIEGKNPELVAAYRTLFEAVTARVPNAYDASVGSLTYVAWKANDIRKASFADIVIQRNRMIISCEVPTSDPARAVGEQIPVDNHHNHYFRIIFDADQTPQIVDAIVESYNQLKVQ